MSQMSQSYGHENVTNGSFFVFSATDSKKLVTVWAKYLIRLKDLLECFQKMVWLIGSGVTVCEILRAEISEKLLIQQKIQG